MSIKNKKIVHPNILILEGLWSDTADALEACGAHTHEESPWDYPSVEYELLSGNWHGMVLTGGSDICPELYGIPEENRHPMVYGIDHQRDRVEYRAMELADQLGIPVLGICRGSQIMNAYHGGSLTQHIDGHSGTDHHVFAAPAARTFKRAIGGREMEVVSLHHQCVDRTGPRFRVAAYSAAGIPEAIESKCGKWLGVQYHPELAAFKNGQAFAIFQWLVREAARYAGGRAPATTFRQAKREREEYERYISAKRAERAESSPPRGTALSSSPASPPMLPRKAGEPSLPSMRRTSSESVSLDEMTTLVRKSISAVAHDMTRGELRICPKCAILFDDEHDLADHILFVHEEPGPVPFYDPRACLEGTCSVIEPPANHEDWDDIEDEREVEDIEKWEAENGEPYAAQRELSAYLDARGGFDALKSTRVG